MICSFEFKTDVLILKMLKFSFGFYAFDFEVIPHPSCYLTFIMGKTPHYSFFCETSAAFLAALEVS